MRKLCEKSGRRPTRTRLRGGTPHGVLAEDGAAIAGRAGDADRTKCECQVTATFALQRDRGRNRRERRCTRKRSRMAAIKQGAALFCALGFTGDLIAVLRFVCGCIEGKLGGAGGVLSLPHSSS